MINSLLISPSPLYNKDNDIYLFDFYKYEANIKNIFIGKSFFDIESFARNNPISLIPVSTIYDIIELDFIIYDDEQRQALLMANVRLYFADNIYRNSKVVDVKKLDITNYVKGDDYIYIKEFLSLSYEEYLQQISVAKIQTYSKLI